MYRSRLRRNFRLCTLDGITATPIGFLLQPGNFIVAALFAGIYRLPPAVYGLIVSLPFWCNFLQAGVNALLLREVPAKTIAVQSGRVQAFVLGLLALLMFWLPAERPAVTGPWFVVFFGVLGMASAFSAVGWTSWIQEWVPPGTRGKYFGTRNRLLQLTTIIFLLGAGALLDVFERSVFAFQLLFAGAVALRILSVRFQQKITAAPARSTAPTQRPWIEQCHELRRNRSFVWLIAYGAVWGFAANFFGAFYPVFMYQELGLSVKFVSTMLILAGIGSAVSYPAWGNLADRFGNKPVMIVCMIAWQLQYVAWFFLTPQNVWLLPVLWTFAGLTSAGFILGLFNVQLKIIPPETKVAAISINLAVTSLVTAIAPMLGGGILGYLLHSGRPALQVYHQLFLAQPVIALLACALLWKVHEPKASPLLNVIGAMRNVRTLGAIFGLTYLVNFVFVKNEKTR